RHDLIPPAVIGSIPRIHSKRMIIRDESLKAVIQIPTNAYCGKTVNPSNYRNRYSPANGAQWVGFRAAAIAYRAPTRRRPLFRRTVGVRPVGARAAAIASAEVRTAPLRPGSAWPGRISEAAMPHYRSAHQRRFPEPFVREIEERFGDC